MPTDTRDPVIEALEAWEREPDEKWRRRELGAAVVMYGLARSFGASFHSDDADTNAFARTLTIAHAYALSQSRGRVKELEGALEFYAKEWRANMDGDPSTPGLSRTWMEPTEKLYDDEGRKARSALTGGK